MNRSLLGGDSATDRPLRILVIEDDATGFLLLECYLRQQQWQVAECRRIDSNAELDAALQTEWDVVLADYNVPGMDFRTVLGRIQAHRPDLPVILVSGSVGEETAVELLRRGLSNFVPKAGLARLSSAILHALNEAEDRRARRAAETALRESQVVALEEQSQARLAALNLMEDALAARARAEAAHAALQESETKYRLLAESASDCIFWLGPDGHFKYVSPASAQISGHAPEEFLANPDLMLDSIHSDDRAAYQQHLTDSTHAKGGELEFRLVRKDGMVRWIGHHCQPIRGANGEYLGRRCAIRDITERKQAEEQLRKLAQAVEQSPESIVITNLDAQIEYVNEAFVRNTGYSREEVIGQNPRILNSKKTPQEIYRRLWDSLVQGQTWKGEFVNRRKDGSEYVEFAIITPLRRPDGRITHYVAVKEDITEKKRVGEELDRHRHHLEELVTLRTCELLVAKTQAEAANRAKSAFLANMSHEIRTPMNTILGLSYLLQYDGVTPRQAERLSKIGTAARHLLSILNDILDLSKIEAGKLQLEQGDFALATVLDHVRSMIFDAAQAKGLSVEVDDGHVPLWLHGDPTRLRQALLNYASNAVKFTERGSITLRARLLGERDGMLALRFEVQDTGLGIAPGIETKLFAAFEQADASTTRKLGGTGLGLAITRHLAHLMGGEVGVESELGKGSTFWFTAYLAHGHNVPPVAVAQVDAKAELCERHAGTRLLLAEDNPVNCEVAQELLEAVGLLVDTAEDGLVALEKAAMGDYALLLMDVQMPNMDGLEATRAIRALPGWGAKPILAMTANAFDENRRACLEAGMNDFVAKPVDPKVLFATLLKWLPDGKSAPGSAATSASPARPTPLSPNQAALAWLATLPGLDLNQGLAVMCGQADQYLRLLRLFAESHGADMARIRKRVAANQFNDASRLAHSLKGVAATLGGNRLANQVARLESALKQGSDGGGLIEAIEPELTALAAAILALPQWDGGETAGSADPARLEQIVNELEQLLMLSDTRAEQLVEDFAPLLCVALGDCYNELRRQVECFDYESALTTLRFAKGRKRGWENQ